MMNDSQTIFIKNLNAALEASPYNKADLAKALDVSKATVTKWFGGENGISQKYLPEVTRLLGHDVPWFYTDHTFDDGQSAENKQIDLANLDAAAFNGRPLSDGQLAALKAILETMDLN